MIPGLVTVIVFAYNHEKFILECLESIHNQTFRDFQWIVVDDCSTDSTPLILKENKEKFGYQLILHEKNKGLSATQTEVIREHAKGEYLSMCASDDMYLPTKIEEQLKFLHENPQYVMCYSRSIPMNLNSEELPDNDKSQYVSGNIFKEVICRDFHVGIDVMFRTEVIRNVGYFEPNIIAEDYYLYSKISKKYQIGFLDKYLYKYRVAELSTKRDPWMLVMSHRQTVEMFKDDPIYKKAVQAWEVKSLMILAPYPKYKYKAIWYLVKNSFYFAAHPKELYYALGHVVLMWY